MLICGVVFLLVLDRDGRRNHWCLTSVALARSASALARAALSRSERFVFLV